MFDRMMGTFLLDSGRLTKEQLTTAYEIQDALQVSEGKDAYRTFAHVLVDDTALLTQEDLAQALTEYSEQNGRTPEEMEILRRDDPEEIVRLQFGTDDDRIRKMATEGIRNLIRLVDRHLYVGRGVNSGYVEGEVFACQSLSGGMDVMSILAGSFDAMRRVAIAHAGEDNILNREDVMDAVCELINTSNGMFVRDHIGENEELSPPSYRLDPYMMEGAEIYVMPIYLCGVTVDYAIARGTDQDLISQGIL